MRERDDRPPVHVDPRLAGKPTAHVVGNPNGDVDSREPLLEVARPLIPEAEQLEILGPLERLLQRAHRGDAGHAVHPHARGPARDEIPGTALEHEPEWVDGPLDDLALLPVADARAAA